VLAHASVFQAAILILAPCRINAAFRPGSERRIYAAARRRSENGRAPKAKMRIAVFQEVGGGEGTASPNRLAHAPARPARRLQWPAGRRQDDRPGATNCRRHLRRPPGQVRGEGRHRRAAEPVPGAAPRRAQPTAAPAPSWFLAPVSPAKPGQRHRGQTQQHTGRAAIRDFFGGLDIDGQIT